MSDTRKRPVCADCGVDNFLTPVLVYCVTCEPTLRCHACHRAHRMHVGVILVQRGKAGPAWMRADG